MTSQNVRDTDVTGLSLVSLSSASTDSASGGSEPPAMTSHDATRLLVDVREAARLLSMGRTAVFDEIRRGRLKSVKRGRARLIPVTCLAEYVNLLLTETEQDVA
jgi:excisionase family DNA binding protein